MPYLLPCPQCERKLSVDTSQAGEQLRCACGASVEVPSMRQIRALEPSDPDPGAERTSRWDPRRGIVFAVGAVITFGGLVVVIFTGLGQLNAMPGERPRENLGPLFERIDAMEPAEALETWTFVREEGLGPYQMSGYAKVREVERQLGRIMLIGLGAALIGALVTISAWWLPKSKIT